MLELYPTWCAPRVIYAISDCLGASVAISKPPAPPGRALACFLIQEMGSFHGLDKNKPSDTPRQRLFIWIPPTPPWLLICTGLRNNNLRVNSQLENHFYYHQRSCTMGKSVSYIIQAAIALSPLYTQLGYFPPWVQAGLVSNRIMLADTVLAWASFLIILHA